MKKNPLGVTATGFEDGGGETWFAHPTYCPTRSFLPFLMKEELGYAITIPNEVWPGKVVYDCTVEFQTFVAGSRT